MTGRRHRTLRISIGAALAVAAAVSACGGSEDLASTPASSTTTSAATTSPTSGPAGEPTTVPPTTAAATTAAPTTAPPTTIAPTTAPATTTPPTTAPPTTAPPTEPSEPGPATAFVTADAQLAEVDVATGATVRVLDEQFSGGDGVFRGGLRLSPDRSTIWFSEGYEDSWFGCESSLGSWGRIDPASGAAEILGTGTGVEPSADGEFVAYVTSSLCIPDPTNPENWVLTPEDRVVVRRLSTGEEREFVTDTPPDSYEAPGAVLGAGFSPGGSLLVLVGDGRLFDVDLDGPAVIQEHPVALGEVEGFPIAATADDLITVVFGDEGSTDLYAIDAASGERRLLASTGAYMAAGVSVGGQIVVSGVEPISVEDPSLVTVLELPDDTFAFDLDW